MYFAFGIYSQKAEISFLCVVIDLHLWSVRLVTSQYLVGPAVPSVSRCGRARSQFFHVLKHQKFFCSKLGHPWSKSVQPSLNTVILKIFHAFLLKQYKKSHFIVLLKQGLANSFWRTPLDKKLLVLPLKIRLLHLHNTNTISSSIIFKLWLSCLRRVFYI